MWVQVHIISYGLLSLHRSCGIIVNYFHLSGFDGKHGSINDSAYFKYLSQNRLPRNEIEKLFIRSMRNMFTAF